MKMNISRCLKSPKIWSKFEKLDRDRRDWCAEFIRDRNEALAVSFEISGAAAKILKRFDVKFKA